VIPVTGGTPDLRRGRKRSPQAATQKLQVHTSPLGRNVMFTTSYLTLRRISAYVTTLLLLCVSFSKAAEAQATTPLVTASFPTALTPPSGLGTVFQTALDSVGDLLFVDYVNSGLYEYPVGGGAVITLVAPGGIGGGYSNPGLAIDSNNNLYIEANYNNCLLRFPYDTVTKTWDGLATVTPANNTTVICPNSGNGTSPFIFAQGDTPNTAPYYFQPWALAVGPNNNLVITAQNSNNFAFEEPVTTNGTTTTAGQANSLLISKMTARVQSVAEDIFGNVYFVEEVDKSGLPGVLMIPAGTTGLTSDAALTRVDPNLPAVTGVATDAAGNLYISDSTDGVFLVPNPSGTPQTASAVLLTPVSATAQVSVDTTRNILYVPSKPNGSQVIYSVKFNAAELGSTATGAPATTPGSVMFGFNGSVTPASFAIQEAGAANPDFLIASSGTCKSGTAYAAQSGCTVNVTLSPNAAGSVSGKLQMLGASGAVLGSINLHGTGLGAAVEVLPGTESAIGSGLKTPSQVAVDAGDNTYVADSGLGAVEMYPKASGAAATTVGTGLTAPTGVAVDGAGDVFIADSGNVLEVPVGASGLNAAGQVTLKSGLGTNVKLATNGMGSLYIADPDNHRVVKLSSVGGNFSLFSQIETDLGGFSTPSSVAVDQNGNLYVVDGANLYEVTPTGTQSTLLTTLSGVTGLVVDPSGSVYVTSAGQTVRIPNVGGTLTPGSETAIAADNTGPTSVALDSTGNLYLTNATAGNVDQVSANATYNFGTLSSTTASASQGFTLLNYGNSPLTFTGFAGTADFSETATTCTSPVAVNATCSVTVTFNPGPGDQGTLSGAVVVTGNAANAPVGVLGEGVGATLAASTTTASVTNPTVDGAPVVVKVAATSGTGATPTGQVALTITAAGLTTPVSISGALASGTVTLSPPQLAAGTYTYSLSYGGDRTYGTSTTTVQVAIGPGPVTLVQPTMAQVQLANPTYPYVLAAQSGSQEPYDGSIVQYEYTYPVQVVATDGTALIGQPVFDSTGKQVAVNYGTVTYQGAPSTSCAPVPVAADGTAPFSTDCFGINTSNTSIPDILTAYTITPVYSPAGTGSSAGSTNPNYAASTGSSISFTALRNPMVQISSNPSSLSISPGSTTKATLTLSSVLGYGIAGSGALLNNYSLPVQLACDGLPAYASCSFSYPTPDPSDPNSVDVGPATGTVLSYQGGTAAPCTTAQGCVGPGTVIMTINTNVPTGAVTTSQLKRAPSGVEFAVMCGVGLLGLAFGKKRSLRGRVFTLVCLLLCGGMMAGAIGCGTTQLGVASGTPTPAGTYAVTVTAKQVGSQTITASPGIVYGNQNQMSLPFTINVTVN
jgi:hypothetical protein